MPSGDPTEIEAHCQTRAVHIRVIRDGDINAEHVGDRSQHTLGLTQRLMEHQAKREARLDGDRRIDRLTASRSGGGGMPCLHGFLGEPHGEDSSPHQRRIVFWPIRHPVPGPRDLMTAALIELVGHGSSKRWGVAPAILQSFRPSRYPPPPRSPDARNAERPYPLFMHQRVAAPL